MSRRQPLPENCMDFTGRDVDALTRFGAKIKRSESGCWLWLAARDRDGYSIFTWEKQSGSSTKGHQFAFEAFRFPIPAGLGIDHLCRNRGCVNPFHMEVVTNAINVLRGNGPPALNARKVRCLRGHEFSPENTRISKDRRRHCQICSSMRAKAYRRRVLLRKSIT